MPFQVPTLRFEPFLGFSHSVYCICPPSPFLFKFLQHSIAVALWPHLLTAASKWCDCACERLWKVWREHGESVAQQRCSIQETPLEQQGMADIQRAPLEPKFVSDFPPTHTHILAQETLTHAFGSLALISLSRVVLLSVWTLDGISIALEADSLSPSSNKKTIVASFEFQTLHLQHCIESLLFF